MSDSIHESHDTDTEFRGEPYVICLYCGACNCGIPGLFALDDPCRFPGDADA